MARGECFSGNDFEKAQHRPNAIRSLEDFPGSRTEALMIQLLSDGDSKVRSKAIWVLAAIAPTSKTVDLLERQLQDSDEGVLHAAIGALASLASTHPRADVIFVRLFKSENPTKRRLATRSLSRLPDSSRIPGFVKKMLQDECSLVRISAAQALGGVVDESEEAITMLRQLLTDADHVIRMVAITSLLRAPPSEELIAELRKRLDVEQDDQVIGRAIVMLGRVAQVSKDARQLLLELSSSLDTPNARLAARQLESLERRDASR